MLPVKVVELYQDLENSSQAIDYKNLAFNGLYQLNFHHYPVKTVNLRLGRTCLAVGKNSRPKDQPLILRSILGRQAAYLATGWRVMCWSSILCMGAGKVSSDRLFNASWVTGAWVAGMKFGLGAT